MNKISEKAVWDELSPSGDEKISQASFGQPVQPQMMFCYNSNQSYQLTLPFALGAKSICLLHALNVVIGIRLSIPLVISVEQI